MSDLSEPIAAARAAIEVTGWKSIGGAADSLAVRTRKGGGCSRSDHREPDA